jgi:hypothetical protein
MPFWGEGLSFNTEGSNLSFREIISTEQIWLPLVHGGESSVVFFIIVVEPQL